MGRFLEALRREAERYEQALAERLPQLDRDGLVAWCKDEIEAYITAIDSALEACSPELVVSHCREGLDIDAVFELAQGDPGWRDAFIREIKKLRRKGEEIPAPWRDFALDVLLKVGRGPDGRGKKNFYVRNEAICRCVRLLVNHTNLKATRAAESENRDCALCIVEDAIAANPAWGNRTGYEGLERVWSEHGATALAE